MTTPIEALRQALDGYDDADEHVSVSMSAGEWRRVIAALAQLAAEPKRANAVLDRDRALHRLIFAAETRPATTGRDQHLVDCIADARAALAAQPAAERAQEPYVGDEASKGEYASESLLPMTTHAAYDMPTSCAVVDYSKSKTLNFGQMSVGAQLAAEPKRANAVLEEALQVLADTSQEINGYAQPEQKCSDDLAAPHGFDRNRSCAEDRYVCECEGWVNPAQPAAEPDAQDDTSIAKIIEALNEYTSAPSCAYRSRLREAARLLAQPAAESDALDAKRYRWLRDQSAEHICRAISAKAQDGDGIKVTHEWAGHSIKPRMVLSGASMDAAIDAAMREEA